MATTYVTFTQTTAETLDGSDFLIVQSRINGTSLSPAVDVFGANNDIYVQGSINNTGGRSVSVAGSSSNLTVAEEGRIFQASSFGGSAVALDNGTGFHTVTNFGQITGNFGIATIGTSTSNKIFNHGTITGTESTSSVAGVAFRSDFNKLTNTGIVTGSALGVQITDVADQNLILNYGEIVGQTGVSNRGQGTELVNHGLISGDRGLSSTGTNLNFVNHGEVVGESGSTFSGDNLEFTNHGTVVSVSGIALSVAGADGMVSNFGTIVGGVISFSSSGVTIENEGLIDGDVEFLSGDNSYLASRDGVVTGAVIGGTGVDMMTGGASQDTMRGGGQADTIRGHGDDDDLKGNAGDDTVKGNRGDDTIAGNNGADTLYGGHGDDIMTAGKGTDVINGGRGDDQMSGGKGNDIFVFARTSDDDVITDFTNNKDSLDLSRLDAASFAEIDSAGVVSSNGNGGSVLDLSLIGGNGLLEVETMSVGQWNAADFIL